MKQTRDTDLCYRANTPAGTGAINGPQWQTVKPPPVVMQQQTRGFPWRLFLFISGLVWIVSIVVNGNRPKTAQERSEPVQVQSTSAELQNPPAVHVERAQLVPVRVMRAMPIDRAPRAEAVRSTDQTNIDDSWLDNPVNLGKWVVMDVPGEGQIWAHYAGRIPDVTGLPTNPVQWTWYATGDGHWWIWMRAASTNRLSWIDP